MTNKIKLACIIGTRPEVIKMAPIIAACKRDETFDVKVICTAQHRDLIDDLLALFDLHADVDMNIMQERQTLTSLTGNLFLKFEPILAEYKFDAMLAQGDTTTTIVTAMAAFYHHIPFGHVEAGLRSFDYEHPFPEEMNRVLTAKLTTWAFAPTEVEAINLKNEGVAPESIYITGNSVIDTLYELRNRNTELTFEIPKNKRIILLTLHRRENFGEPILTIFKAILEIANKFDDVVIYYPVHPNPNVNAFAHEILGSHPSIHLLKPVRYDEFVTLMNKAYLILSDSGGIQEEAPALSKPLLILREKTERPLVVELGLGKLVGSDTDKIVNAASELLSNPTAYAAMARNISPYGDGTTADSIVKILKSKLLK